MNFHYLLSKLKQKLFLKNFDILYKQGIVNPPSIVIWDSTRKCNLDCVHCGAKESDYKIELNTEEIKRIINELSALGVKNFQITGGEPLLRNDFIEILIYAKKKGLTTNFATNGWHIDENKAELISNAKVSLVQISIDGPENIHNFIRKNIQSFREAIKAVKLLKKRSKSKITVSTIVMPQNLESLNRLRDILASLKIDFWNIGTVMPIGKAKDNPSLFLSKKQFKQLMEFIINSKKVINIDVGENFPYLGSFEKKIRKSPKICPVGILYCCIGVNGYVRGCPDQPDNDFYREGNLRTEKFEDIWKKGFKRYRNRDIIKKDKKCSICDYKNDCFGGCYVMRENNLHCVLDHQ